MTIKDAAEHLGVGWDKIKDIQKRYLQLWEQDIAFATQLKMYDWYHQAMATGVRHCQEFARTLLAHAHGILAWYKHPISNGQVEGTNNKIKTMNRPHYGLRDEEFFKLKLYQLRFSRMNR